MNIIPPYDFLKEGDSAVRSFRSGPTRFLRGGRMTKWKGQVASFAPFLAQIVVYIAGLSFAVGFSIGAAEAANRYWDPNGTALGRGGTGTWDISSGYWSPNGDGVSGPFSPWNNTAFDSAIFGGTAGTVTLIGSIAAQNLTFETNGYILAGGTLTLGNSAAPTITTNGVNATINSVIAGTNGLTKLGGGALALNGVNTFAGSINVNGGELSINGSAALGAAGNSVVMAGNTTLRSAGSLSDRVISLASGQVSVAGAGVGNAHFAGAGGLLATNTVNLTDSTNSFSGAMNMAGTGGQTSFSSIANKGVASALGAGTDPIGVFSNGVYVEDGNFYATYTGGAASSDRDWMLRAQHWARAGIVNAGTGTLTLSGNIVVNYAGSAGRTGSGVFSTSSADLDLQGVIGGGNNSNYVIFGGGGVNRKITLGSANTYTGGSQLENVTVEVQKLADIGLASSLGTGQATGNINILNQGVLACTGTGDTTNRSFTVDGAARIANIGTGALNLSGAVTFRAGGTPNDTLPLGARGTSTTTCFPA